MGKAGRPPTPSPFTTLRLALRLTQPQLAAQLRAALGWGSVRQVSRWETGQRPAPAAVTEWMERKAKGED